MAKPKLIVFASGTRNGGGSGFENLVVASRNGPSLASARDNSLQRSELDADIVAVVSNHEHGGVRERADRLGIPFIHFEPHSYSNVLKNIRIRYREIVETSGAEWVALSGWLKLVSGLDPARTFNIHPALLSQLGGRFGGPNMYGQNVHETVKAAFDAGEITESGLTMHFVTDEYDRGPAFFEFRVPLKKGMSSDEIAKAVNAAEHEWQPKITNMVVHREIRWDGKDPESLIVPEGYKYLPAK
ncbi:MAG: formyltransferase family protein [bacterium]|nr:formyltransferase family protein [bacterium]